MHLPPHEKLSIASIQTSITRNMSMKIWKFSDEFKGGKFFSSIFAEERHLWEYFTLENSAWSGASTEGLSPNLTVSCHALLFRAGGVHTMQPARSPSEVWTPDEKIDFCGGSSRNAKSSVYVSVSTDTGKSFKWPAYDWAWLSNHFTSITKIFVNEIHLKGKSWRTRQTIQQRMSNALP